LALLITLGQDLRFAARSLRKSPGFVATVVLSLALGIGANSTIFSVIDTLLYRPLPYDHPEQLTVITEISLGHPDSDQPPPIAELIDWKKQNHVFQDIALTSFGGETVVSGTGQAEPVAEQDVTPNFFELLGAKPMLGRVSFPSEMQDHDQTIVISYGFWKTHFNRDPHVLGKTLQVSGLHSTIVGVMPQNFATFYGEKVALWQPVNPDSKRYVDRSDHWLTPIARLKPSVTIQQARAEMDAIARQLEQEYPATNKGIGSKVTPLRDFLFGWAKKTLYPLFGAVGFVLLIACANVANLLQSRSEVRRGEYAVRLSFGAGRTRLVQQSLVESGLLALLGGLFGLLIAYFGIRLFLWLAGSDFPNANVIALNLRVVLFTFGVSLLTIVLFGIVPAFQASNPDLNSALRQGRRGTTSSAGRLIFRLLPITEVALAMVLLVGTGLMVNTMLRLGSVNPGFDTSHLLTMTLQLPEGGKYVERVPGGDMEKATPAVKSFHQRLLEKITALPGVESAGTITGLPNRFSENYSFSIFGRPIPAPEQRPQAGYTVVSPSLFRTLKIPLKRGRLLDDHDTEAAPWAVIVNEAFVRRYFPNEDPIGKQLQVRLDPYPTEEDHPRQIVGVVGDVRHYSLALKAPPFMYGSYLQQPAVYPGGAIVSQLWQDLAVRTAPGVRTEDLVKAIRQIVAELDSDQPITNIMPMDKVFSASLGDRRLYMQLLIIFAGLAIFLAAMGIYGVLSYFVGQHTHDIGIRMALGAHKSDVLSWIASLGLKLVLIGIVVGAVLAVGLTRLLAAFLFEVKFTDPLTYLAVGLALAAIAFVACYVPARRATKVDPLVALRYE
jgi:putative ABC transport system permease protein